VDRLACVDLPALPLQLLIGRHADWAAQPTAVVDRDKPLGLIEWVNEHARAHGVLPGMRYAAALALCPPLRAGEVAAADVAACVKTLADVLRRFTPEVEPADGEPGVFWLDAGGLDRLFPSRAAWGARIRRALAQAGFASVVVIGFSRFGTYAIARAKPTRGVTELANADDEARAAARVPLARVALDPDARDRLAQLGVHTVGEFLALPAGGVLSRFGHAAHRLHELASGARWAPLKPRAPDEVFTAHVDLDDPDADAASLAFTVKQLLDPLLERLTARGEAANAVAITLTLADRSIFSEEIRPAEPTRDGTVLLALLRLRLESLKLAAGALRVAVTARGTRPRRDQLSLLDQKPRRDPDAARRALARVRASFGDDAVVRARLRDGHLPEARFAWEPLDAADASAFAPARPRDVPRIPLIRRIAARPIALPPRPAREPDGWLVRGLSHGPVARTIGPYRIAGGWWRTEIDREYYFTELRSGATLWVYYDRKRRRWFLHGQVS
jgi:protein ImuB